MAGSGRPHRLGRRSGIAHHHRLPLAPGGPRPHRSRPAGCKRRRSRLFPSHRPDFRLRVIAMPRPQHSTLNAQRSTPNHPDAFIAQAREVLSIEAAAVAALADRLDAEFVRACELVLACRGRVVLTGIGKSGAIARKIAATLASTGTPALFLHPSEGVHGDLGMVTAGDVVRALSYSGESDEMRAILPVLKRLAVGIIAVTGGRDDPH